MPTQPPPWIILLFFVQLAVSEDAINETTTVTESTTLYEESNVTLTRMNRGTSPGLTQYPTYYLARSYTNEAGERRNVLIPVQATPTPETTGVDISGPTSSTAAAALTTYQAVSPSPSAHDPTKIYALTQDMLMTLHKAGLISQPAPLTTLQALPATVRPTEPTQLSSAYSSPQITGAVYKIRVKPTTSPPSNRYRIAGQGFANRLKSQAYSPTKYKPSTTRLYNTDHRHRFRTQTRPEKQKYTSTKLQFSLPTTPSPYTNKVRFELEDARVPSSQSIALKPVSPTQSSPLKYTGTTPTTGLSQYLEAGHQNEFYFAQEGEQVEYVSVPAPQQGTPSSPTARPQAVSSGLHYIDDNALLSLPRPPPTRSSTPHSSPPATLHQHFSQNLASDDRNPAPHIEYAHVTDIDVAPESENKNKHIQYTNIRQPQVQYTKQQSQSEYKPVQSPIQYLQPVRNSVHNGGSHYVQYVPTHPTPLHLQYLLQANSLRINPKPQLTFASDSGDIRASVRPPKSQDEQQIQILQSAQPQGPLRYSNSDIKSTSSPDIEFIQSNEVTFAPGVMQYPPSSTLSGPPIQSNNQYAQDAVTPVQSNSQYVHSDTQHIQDTNSVTPIHSNSQYEHSNSQYVQSNSQYEQSNSQYLPSNSYYIPETNAAAPVQSNSQYVKSNSQYIQESITVAPVQSNSYVPNLNAAAPAQSNSQYIQESITVAPVQSNSQYIHNSNAVAPVQSNSQYIQESNAVTPAPAAHSTSNPNEPTPSIELEYTIGKLPPMVQEAYNILQKTSQLPQRITADNIDGSINTLTTLLKGLHQYQQNPKQSPLIKNPHEQYKQQPEHSSTGQSYPEASGGSTPGRPGIDYPTYSKIPKTSFECGSQRYKGFFGDPETQCQVWHYCDLNGGQASFLCPNGTIFNQVALTCDWWFNVKCASTSQLYVLNERLYKYILPFAPSFPEDYSGPGVDRYLTAKFKEQEIKSQVKARKAPVTPAPETLTASPEASSTTEATQ